MYLTDLTDCIDWYLLYVCDWSTQVCCRIMSLGHNIWAYSYMRVLYKHNINVFFG